ncbi:GNAT family protein [Micromonospora sp. WMMD1128]|uniref:GNAT family N-acetyltransferase n=1 Tax=Micromonospora sp. WMMD1128 TaxID=3015150 RepID=UPI00248AFD74|nr:GNAT family protein [Micromonospora sp. WMMD1128]WBB71721.1 GNAT family protein [Micromonospora sp. WMMD1128]
MLTGRIVGIRPMEVDDLRFLADLANHPGVRNFVGGWEWPISPDAQAEWFQSSQRDPRTRRLTVTDGPNGEPLGLTGLWDVDWHNRGALTAIKLMPGRAPKGAGSDAIKLIMAWAFYDVGLRRLHSTILAFNGPSYGAYVRRCGWRVEGREHESVFRGGQWHDLLRVAALRPDFDALADAADYVERVCGPMLGLPRQHPVEQETWATMPAVQR